jgi:hypothetical protein
MTFWFSPRFPSFFSFLLFFWGESSIDIQRLDGCGIFFSWTLAALRYIQPASQPDREKVGRSFQSTDQLTVTTPGMDGTTGND